MKKSFQFLGVFTLLFALSVQCKTVQNINHTHTEELNEASNQVQNTLIIHYDSTITSEELTKIITSYGAEIKYNYNIINAIAIIIPKDKKIKEVEKYFKKVKGVSLVERDSIMKAQ